MIEKLQDTKKAEHLFAGWQETIIWSCLQKIMGEIYVDCPENPASAMAILGDFCFFAGEPAEELVCIRPEWHRKDFIIMVPQHDGWPPLIEACYKGTCRKTVRYALKKESDVFVKEKLQQAVESLPEEYTLRMLDEELYERCRKESWCCDWVAQYGDYEEYQEYGLGAVILKGEEIVSGASSYSGYLEGIEIEIDTKEEYRRKGLAYVSGAKLILECLKRNLYPSWDAQNLWSVALAEKLGYHFSHEYEVYEVWGLLSGNNNDKVLT